MEVEPEAFQTDLSKTKIMTKDQPIKNCKVYWGKEQLTIEADLNEPFIVFKTQVFAMTLVPPERQKLIQGGSIITDDTWLDFMSKKDPKLRMVGTNEVIVIPKIAEVDKTPKAIVAKLPPHGIKNFGNTCYMNSVLQVIRTISELKEAISKNVLEVNTTNEESTEIIIIKTISELFKALDQRSETYENAMLKLIATIETKYPEYAGSIEKGGRPQQDANEFFMRFVSIFKSYLNYQPNQYVKERNLVEILFGIEMEKQIKCLEKGGDSTKITNQIELQLSCYISAQTKFMMEGITNKLNDITTMRSALLNRDASFSLNTFITRLPAYLCVQFVRFYYKDQEKVNAKIMKDVKFPMRLDLSELCASSLKEKFKPMVAQIRDFENKLSLTNNESSIKILTKRQDNGVISLPEQKLGPGDSGSGIYQLIAVLTHEGRTTSSGHYVAWVRFEPKKWAKMDDATVSLVEENDILKLSGGGESHCAYLLIYQTFKVPKI